MNNITHLFDDLYLPRKAIIIYEHEGGEDGRSYVEAYDMDGNGRPINAHPLDVQECAGLASALDNSDDLRRDFLKPKGLLPENVLYLNPSHDGCAIWHTKEQEVNLFFTDELTIPSGKVKIPALLWKAYKERLYVYALKTNKKPNEQTSLYHAPFFNIHEDGGVCMGTVEISIEQGCFLEEFISQWENYFFNSYFSHLMEGHNPVQGNIVQLWQQQVKTANAFPADVLKKHSRTIKDLLR